MSDNQNQGATPGGASAPSAPAGGVSPPTQPSSPAPSTSPSAGGEPSAPSGVDILNFDPFAPPTEGTEQPGDGTQPPAPAAQPAPTSPSAPTQPQVSPEVAALRQEIAQLRSMVQPQGQQPQGQQPGQPAAPKPQRYKATVPPQIMQMMSSEDPNERMQGVTTLVNGIGEMVHDTVMAEVSRMIQEVQTQVPQVVQNTTREAAAAKQTFDDFYGKFPQLNNPRLFPIVTQVAAELAQSMGISGWTPEFRDKLGAEVMATLGWQAQAPAPNPKPAAQKPNAVNSGGARPAPAIVGDDADGPASLLN